MANRSDNPDVTKSLKPGEKYEFELKNKKRISAIYDHSFENGSLYYVIKHENKIDTILARNIKSINSNLISTKINKAIFYGSVIIFAFMAIIILSASSSQPTN